jgi:hypothetical protein
VLVHDETLQSQRIIVVLGPERFRAVAPSAAVAILRAALSHDEIMLSGKL